MVLSLYLEPCEERVLSESFNESITNRSEFFSFIIIFWDHCHICGLPLAKTSWCGAWLNTWLIGLDFMWLQKDMENYEIWQISSIPLNHIPTGLIVLLCTCRSCSLEHSAASSDWPSPIYPSRQSSRHFFWYPNAEKAPFTCVPITILLIWWRKLVAHNIFSQHVVSDMLTARNHHPTHTAVRCVHVTKFTLMSCQW